MIFSKFSLKINMSFKRRKKTSFGQVFEEDDNSNGGGHGVGRFSVLVGNYSPLTSANGIIQSIVDQIRRSTGNELDFKYGLIFPQSLEFTISLPNAAQMKAVLDLNGSLIHNNRIWIIKFPAFYEKYGLDFSEIFNKSICNGQIDLSNLRKKFDDLGKNATIIDFNKQDFVEFLFYRLGTESRDKRFFIHTLILNNNFIQDINEWNSYFAFLPTLHTIILNQNPIKRQPYLPSYPYITIQCDKKFQQGINNFKKFQNSFGNEQNDFDENQNGFNDFNNFQDEFDY